MSMSQPPSGWAKYSIASLSAASTATSFGFTAAKLGTRLSFGAARTVTFTAASLAGLSIDYALFGSNKGTSLALQSLTEPTLSFIESVALTPILVGETITSTSFIAARTSVNALCAISAALGGSPSSSSSSSSSTTTNFNAESDPHSPNALTTMSAMYPGSDDASFSLASFVQLVRREWNEPVFHERVPPGRKLSVSEVARALVAWGVLQGVTQEWQEKRWFTALREIRLDVLDEGHSGSGHSGGHGGGISRRSSVGGLSIRSRKPSRLKVTREEGQVITADIGEAEKSLERDGKRALSPISDQYWSRYGTNTNTTSQPTKPRPPPRLTNQELKSTLRRLSKMVLGGYGGAGFIFFGVSYHPQAIPTTSSSSSQQSSQSSPPSQSTTESTMNQIITAAEEEAESSASDPAPRPVEPKLYSWWNVLLGRHDQELFERYAFWGDGHAHAHKEGSSASSSGHARHGTHDSTTSTVKEKMESKEASPKSTAVLGKESEMPRYWVLTDHGRKQIVLVFRGTMSLNELAVDLTCEPAPFRLSHSWDEPNLEAHFTSTHPSSTSNPAESGFPGDFASFTSSSANSNSTSYQPFPSSTDDTSNSEATEPVYEVHSGMLRVARYMGAQGRPVHTAVADALKKNSRYELVLCGHSLGAGVAALLALSWADPSTCVTVPSSGLPPGRRVSCYCFAPPCITDAPLSRLASDMITSFVYSHDIVSRLSLGSVRDMFCTTSWLGVGDIKNTTVDETGKPRTANVGEGSASVTARAIKWKAGFGSEGDEEWFLALRKTLEANMTMNHLYPPGRIWWAVRDGDLHPSNRSTPTPESSTTSSTPTPLDPKHSHTPRNDKNAEKEREKNAAKKIRLFEVTDVERVFSQIVFARDMLTSHLPDRYDYVLHELL